ncbi:sugar kinase [Labrys wisconsinensis]|uniref:2-dehydro-3-deoxygluconokinase n=1 Tax=Labrys wisconsinensis TaxID=425677 RepID=A0ABU0JCX8_9HYPH|nr:sugar kinase [Labrys wisconsinensis]MDQ0471104.1 2-dehydro-3-deoxygluconokinase [Labrys wisconsinensis]
MTDLLALGECMVELSRQPDGRFSLAYGGDTFNTAAYAARLGLAAAYGTALGDDPYSRGILDLAAAEAVDTTLVPRLPGRVPGLYVIETDGRGERSFFYWRDTAPARELFELPAAEALVAAMARARCVYFSGITLSLYGPAGLDRFERSVAAARAAGARIAFDGNFRPRNWKGDLARARAVFARFLVHVDLALPTFDDEQALWGDADPAATLDRLAGHGIAEIVIKNGPAGVSIRSVGLAAAVPVPAPVEPVDTTAAGDSFNAGYLAGRLRGAEPGEAALLGHRLAAVVIRHRGAIVPKAATAGLAA